MSTLDIKPFFHTQNCPKCNAQRWPGGDNVRYYGADTQGPERLWISCWLCKYQWYEYTADYKPPKGPPPPPPPPTPEQAALKELEEMNLNA